VSAMSRPRPMTTRWSAVSSSSLIRWLDTSTARPSAASDRRKPADPADAVGVQPVHRLVEQEHRGVAQHGTGDAQPLEHAQGEPAGASPRGRRQPHELEHLVDPSTGEAVGLGHPEQVVPCPSTRVDRGGIQQRADVEKRCP
jgi:hypothetical protein